MATSQLPEHLRVQVKRAITHYAHFYAELVGDNPEKAVEQLSSISELDKRVRSQEPQSTFNAYLERRSQLMRIFQFQLVKTIEGQVQQELLDEAEKLVNRLEIMKEAE